MTTASNKPRELEEDKLTFNYIDLGRKTEVDTVDILQTLSVGKYGMMELRYSGEEEAPFQLLAFNTDNQPGVIHSLGAEFEETINFESDDNLWDLIANFNESEYYKGSRFIIKADDMDPKQFHVFRVNEESNQKRVEDTEIGVLDNVGSIILNHKI